MGEIDDLLRQLLDGTGASQIVPPRTPAVIAAASFCASTALALVSKARDTIWPFAPATVTVGMY